MDQLVLEIVGRDEDLTETPEVASGKGFLTVPLVGLEPSSKSHEETSQIVGAAVTGGAESGAVPNEPVSPAFSLLLKLTADLSPGERVVLARMLGRVD